MRPELTSVRRPGGGSPASRNKDRRAWRIAEIGVGYGGLCHALFVRLGVVGIESYTLVDLQPVERLAKKVLMSVLDQRSAFHRVHMYHSPKTGLGGQLLNDIGEVSSGETGRVAPTAGHTIADMDDPARSDHFKYDLCISTYAFSELSVEAANSYTEILSHCARGYFLWNPLSLEVRANLPILEHFVNKVFVNEEVPSTHISRQNKVLTWNRVEGEEEIFALRREAWATQLHYMGSTFHPDR